MTKPPTILLVVATYNCAATLARCLDSFVAQDYPHKKLAVIDGGSDDGTVEIIKKYEKHIDYWVSEPDKGIYDAWNKALTAPIEWDWVQFMGGDDHYYDGQVLGAIASCAKERSPRYKMLYAKTKMIHISGVEKILGKEWNVEACKKKPAFPSGQVSFFYAKNIFEKYGFFDSKLQIAGDMEHFFRYMEHERFWYMPNIISTVHHEGGISTSPVYDWMHWKEKNRILRQYGYGRVQSVSSYYIALVRLIKLSIYRCSGERVLLGLVSRIRCFTGGRKMKLLSK